MVYPVSFIYVWTKFDLQFQHLYASQKVWRFSFSRKWETLFQHEQGHQKADAYVGSNKNIENRTRA